MSAASKWVDPLPWLIVEIDERYSQAERDSWDERSTEYNIASFRPRTRHEATGDFEVGDRVTHAWFGGDTGIVYGHVTEHDESEQKTQVKWADGSGPTWHLTRELMLLKAARESGQ